MLPACELSSGTRPAATRPTSTASNTLRIDGSACRSASGKSASAPSSEYAPASPWYATTFIPGAYEADGSAPVTVLTDDDRGGGRKLAVTEFSASSCGTGG